MLLKVQWVDKANAAEPHLRIRVIGGVSGELPWKHTQAQAIESIERGLFAYYVEKDAHATRLDVGRTASGEKFLTTRANGGISQTLLDLPAFPAAAT